MTTIQRLSLFISSKMQELLEERLALEAALKTYHMEGWLWEKSAGARPEPVRSTYLKAVEDCDIYIGLLWLGYGQYTIDEYEHARHLHKPCLVYVKDVYVDKRSPQLTAFLQGIEQVTNPDGLTVYHFKTKEELVLQLQQDVLYLLTSCFRETREQPPEQQEPSSGSLTMTATKGGIAIYKNQGGSFTQTTYNYPRPPDEQQEH